MTTTDLVKEAEELEARILRAGPGQRAGLQPRFTELLERMDARGDHVPMRMRELERKLNDEVVEARFDNMPL